jgi:hypothetical protein
LKGILHFMYWLRWHIAFIACTDLEASASGQSQCWDVSSLADRKLTFLAAIQQ